MTAPLEPPVTTLLDRIYGPGCEVISLDRLTGGANQETFRLVAQIGEVEPRTFALRRAAGGHEHDPDSSSPGLAVEAELFRAARAAGIPEPEVFAVFEPDDGLGPGFLMEWLDGETLGPRIVRSDAYADVRPKLARQCGEVLARIHGIELSPGLKSRLTHQTPQQFVHDMWSRYQQLETVQPMIDYTALWLLDNLPAMGTPTLVHNDFRNGNLMISEELGIIAVLDWELAHVGDPMRDLGWVCCNSWRFGGALPVGGFGTREDLFAGYESVSNEPINPEHVKFWEVFGSFWWAVMTLEMAHDYRNERAGGVERVAIGRRTSECQMDCVNLLFPGPYSLDAPNPAPTDISDQTELLTTVRDFLKTEVLPGTEGRMSFLSRVSSNALDIVLRESALDGSHLRDESARLTALGFVAPPGSDHSLVATVGHQRMLLIDAMKGVSVQLGNVALEGHLRQTVAQQLAIDQPRYSALASQPG